MSTLAPNGEQPWITARVVAATEFCPRAGIIAYEDKQGDIGEEHDSGPRLDYLPDFSLEMLAASLQATVNSIWLGLTWAPPVLLVVGIAGYVSNSTILLVLIPVAYFGGRWLIQKLRNVAELSRRLRAAQDAVPSEPSAESTELQPVNWWSLLKAGFSSVEYEDAHEDPALRFSGKPWRVLHKGSLRIPVFRKRAGKPELHQQQLARMAAYCHLIVQAEGSHSPYGIVLFDDGYDGVTVPFTRENRELFQRTLRRARELFAAIAANGSALWVISPGDCEQAVARNRAGRATSGSDRCFVSYIAHAVASSGGGRKPPPDVLANILADQAGIRTVSITWISPFEAATSVASTFAVPPAASVSTTAPSTSVAVSVAPLTVVMV